MADLEQRLCEAIEPVLIKFGIPPYGLPLGPDPASGYGDGLERLAASGGGDRGDMTSDIARAAIEVMRRWFSELAEPIRMVGHNLAAAIATGHLTCDVCGAAVDEVVWPEMPPWPPTVSAVRESPPATVKPCGHSGGFTLNATSRTYPHT